MSVDIGCIRFSGLWCVSLAKNFTAVENSIKEKTGVSSIAAGAGKEAKFFVVPNVRLFSVKYV